MMPSHDPLLPHLTVSDADPDFVAFARSALAYERVNLVAHAEKASRRQLRTVIWGAEIDGLKGTARVPVQRVITLSAITADIASLGWSSVKQLSSLLGMWIAALLYRRPMLSLLQYCFHELVPADDEEMFPVPANLKNELTMLSVLSPWARGSMRATPAAEYWTIDASEWGIAGCSAPIAPEVTRELWRHVEKRGYHAPLLSRAQSSLQANG